MILVYYYTSIMAAPLVNLVHTLWTLLMIFWLRFTRCGLCSFFFQFGSHVVDLAHSSFASVHTLWLSLGSHVVNLVYIYTSIMAAPLVNLVHTLWTLLIIVWRRFTCCGLCSLFYHLGSHVVDFGYYFSHCYLFF